MRKRKDIKKIAGGQVGVSGCGEIEIRGFQTRDITLLSEDLAQSGRVSRSFKTLLDTAALLSKKAEQGVRASFPLKP